MAEERSAWIHDRICRTRQHIAEIAERYGRTHPPTLLAVSKSFPAADILCAARAGQTLFGESYVQEALGKIRQLRDNTLEWHFIGPLQTNKTRAVAEHFAWAHGIDRPKIAHRLSAQRPASLPDLQICIQVNICGERNKSGVFLDDLPRLVEEVAPLPGLRLRGLMAIPVKTHDFSRQRAAFHALFEAFQALNSAGLGMDTLSMGMTQDLEAAIAEGSTLVRLGTAIFGPRRDRNRTGRQGTDL